MRKVIVVLSMCIPGILWGAAASDDAFDVGGSSESRPSVEPVASTNPGPLVAAWDAADKGAMSDEEYAAGDAVIAQNRG